MLKFIPIIIIEPNSIITKNYERRKYNSKLEYFHLYTIKINDNYYIIDKLEILGEQIKFKCSPNNEIIKVLYDIKFNNQLTILISRLFDVLIDFNILKLTDEEEKRIERETEIKDLNFYNEFQIKM